MASIDIRDNSIGGVSVIYFSDPADNNAYYLDDYGSKGVSVYDDNTYINIASKEDAQNLIKALEKAIELGWWN